MSLLTQDLINFLSTSPTSWREEHLVYFDDAPVFIPLIASHLDSDVMKSLELNKQDHLVPIASISEEG